MTYFLNVHIELMQHSTVKHSNRLIAETVIMSSVYYNTLKIRGKKKIDFSISMIH